MNIFFQKIDTPIGEMISAEHDSKIVMLEFGDRKSLDKEILEIEKALKTTFFEKNKKTFFIY